MPQCLGALQSRLEKFNGVKRNFELHVKEYEWRCIRTLSQLVAGKKLLISKNKNLMVSSLKNYDKQRRKTQIGT